MPDVADLRVKVSADVSDAERGLDSLNSKVGGIGGSIATAFGGAAIAGIAALGAGVVASVSKFSEFEAQLNILKVTTGATDEQLAALSAQARALGSDMDLPATSSAGAATAMLELAKAGLSVDQTMAAAKGTLQLAAAAGIDEAKAAQLASGALNAFGLGGEKATQVANQLAFAANASALDAADLGQAVSQAGFIFKATGRPMEELLSSMIVLGNAGLSGSDGATALKNALMQASAPTKAAADTMKQYGISLFDAQGNMKSVPEIIDILNGSLGTLTVEQRNAALSTIFQSDGMKALIPLMAAGGDKLREYEASLKTSNAASEQAEARSAGISGALKGLNSQWETLQETVGSKFAPVVEETIRSVAENVGDLTPVMADLAERGAEALAASGRLIADVWRNELRPVIDWFKENWPLIQQTYHTVAGGIGDDNTALASNFQTTWGGMKGTVATRIAEIGDAIRLAMQIINGDWEGAWQTTKTIADREQKLTTANAEANAKLTQQAIDKLTGGMLTRVETDMAYLNTNIWGPGWETVKRTASDAWDGASGIASQIAASWDAIKTGTDTAGKALNNVIVGIWDAIYTNVIQPKLNTITTAVETAWQAVSDKAHAILDPFLTYLRDTIFEPIRAAIQTKIEAARDLFGAAVQAVSDKAHAILDPLLSWWRDTIMEPMRSATESATTGGQGILAKFTAAVDGVKSVVDTTLQGVKSAWETTWGAIQRAAESPQQAMQVLIDLVNKLKSIIPEWLIPHSPTPFQIGLEGIMKAAKGMDSAFGSMGGGMGMIGAIGQLASSIGGTDFGKAAAAISALETMGGKHLHEIGGTGAVGPFQFDPGGELQNFARDMHVSMAEAARIAMAEPMKAAAWALHGYLGTALRAGIGQGLSGADLAAYAQRYGQRSKNPDAVREWYERLFGAANGAIVMPRPGGTPLIAGEGGRPEAIVPLPRGMRGGLGGDTYITLDARGAVVYDGSKFEDMLVRSLEKANRAGKIVKVTR